MKPTTRRGLLAASFLIPLLLAGSAKARMKRVSQKMAQYQNHPKGFQSCASCTYFQSPKRCKAVFGQVDAKGWCMLFDMVD